MKRVVAISGTEAAPGPSPRMVTLGWMLVIGTAALVFIGTLLLRPGER